MYFKHEDVNLLNGKEWEKIVHANINQRKSAYNNMRKKHFKVKNITGDKDHFIMVKGSIYWVRLYQNVHVSNNRASEYMN